MEESKEESVVGLAVGTAEAEPFRVSASLRLEKLLQLDVPLRRLARSLLLLLRLLLTLSGPLRSGPFSVKAAKRLPVSDQGFQLTIVWEIEKEIEKVRGCEDWLDTF